MPTLESLDERIRMLENVVIELATISKYSRILIVIFAASIGLDVSGLGV